MSAPAFYPIGQAGQKWQQSERQQWRAQAKIQRSYQHEVLTKTERCVATGHFSREQYGALDIDSERYPLYCLKSFPWSDEKPTVLITGGVHGYETSGVQGALLFAREHASDYFAHVNFIIVPCVSPWGYETINRWNPDAIDPNRSFYAQSPSQEAAALMQLVANSGDIIMHIDLHETTDTDETEFRRALAARDGLDYQPGTIPDGFYTVADSVNPQPEFQAAVIQAVSAVTHIAPADDNGEIIGSTVMQPGVIYYAMQELGLCGSVSNCRYTTTTEVYPDSTGVTDDECNRAQVAAICGGLNYVLAQMA